MFGNDTSSKREGFVTAGFCLALIIFAIAFILCGCMGNKASHQNGIVAYLSASGPAFGLGYGETEDLPGGCIYYREVVNDTPAFWAAGTNHTQTITFWDTRWMGVTGAPPCKCKCGQIIPRLIPASERPREPATAADEPPPGETNR